MRNSCYLADGGYCKFESNRETKALQWKRTQHVVQIRIKVHIV
jgi:hypothetical protein